MNKDEILDEINSLINEGNKNVLSTRFEPLAIGANYLVNADVFSSWRAKILTFLKLFLNDDNEFIKEINVSKKNYYSNASKCIIILEEITDYIKKDLISINAEPKIDDIESLNKIFNRFHRVARQLRSRHNGRKTLEIEDEYDVQDLLHALLKIFFDDVRSEEWTPSYAGKCARVDFLLKNEKIVIEVKKTRQGLADKELGDQLIIDIARYKSHLDCKKLVCFVYDPEGRIGNPEGIKKDLESIDENFVQVFIQPE